VTRRLLLLACRAFPREHRARQSDEILDTALLAASGSAWRAVREALSLVKAGMRERFRAQPRRPLRGGLASLALVLATANLAIAVEGIVIVLHPPPPISILGPPGFVLPDPYVFDWWWIAFPVAATGLVLGLTLGVRSIAVGAALANLGLVAYDALFLETSSYLQGHLRVFGFFRGPDGYPIGQEWLAPAIVLALATAAARPRRRLGVLPLSLGAAAMLVAAAHGRPDGFFFLRWPLAALIVLAMVLGVVAPRLAVLAVGVSLALAPSVVQYLTGPSWAYKDPLVTWVAAPGLGLAILLPLAYLTRRRLT
jgi:hypothetical protein